MIYSCRILVNYTGNFSISAVEGQVGLYIKLVRRDFAHQSSRKYISAEWLQDHRAKGIQSHLLIPLNVFELLLHQKRVAEFPGRYQRIIIV